MSGVSVLREEVVTLKDSQGTKFHAGDELLLRIKGEDIVCRFKGLGSGFFITETMDGAHENKYRQRSIDKCMLITGMNAIPKFPN